MTATYTIRRGRIEEHVVPGKRLGRNLHHDSRSLAYRYQSARPRAAAASVLWPRRIPILDQGDTGSCTGNALDGALGTDPFFAAIPPGTDLSEAMARSLYSAAERIDGGAGLPSEDAGSSGLSVCKAAKAAGLISGYAHAMSVQDMIDALQDGPVITGSNWYDSMDRPDGSGLVVISPGAVVRGMHEYEVRGADLDRELFRPDNSWGLSFGVAGSFGVSFADMERLLAEDGDCTVPVPLSRPAPVPVPPSPAPVPPVADAADLALVQALDPWASARHTGVNGRAVRSYQDWRAAKGLI